MEALTRLAKHETLLAQIQQALTCQICLELMHAPCGHLACRACLVRWFRTPPPRAGTLCPHCRAPGRTRPAEVWGVKGAVAALAASGLLPPSGGALYVEGEEEGGGDPWAGIFPPLVLSPTAAAPLPPPAPVYLGHPAPLTHAGGPAPSRLVEDDGDEDDADAVSIPAGWHERDSSDDDAPSAAALWAETVPLVPGSIMALLMERQALEAHAVRMYNEHMWLLEQVEEEEQAARMWARFAPADRWGDSSADGDETGGYGFGSDGGSAGTYLSGASDDEDARSRDGGGD